MRVSSSNRAIAPCSIARMIGLGTSASRDWPLGEQPRVVPAVADRLLAGAGRALHDQRRVAADRRGEVLARASVFAVPGSPSSSSARSVASVAMAISTSRRSPMYFGVTTVAVRQLAADDVGRRPPTARAASRAGAACRLAASASSSAALACSAWLAGQRRRAGERLSSGSLLGGESRSHAFAEVDQLQVLVQNRVRGEPLAIAGDDGLQLLGVLGWQAPDGHSDQVDERLRNTDPRPLARESVQESPAQ